ncbi:unnamed protein product [Arctogadus glacialis]
MDCVGFSDVSPSWPAITGHQHEDTREGSSPFDAWLPLITDRPPKKLLSRVMATIQVAMRSVRKNKVGVIVADAPLSDGEGDGKTEAEGARPAPPRRPRGRASGQRSACG